MKKIYFLVCLLCFISSLDAQNDWELLNPKPSFRSNRSMKFATAATGYLVNGYQLLETQDAGTTWTVKETIYGAEVIEIKNGIGFIVGRQGLVYRTTDNGLSWQNITIGATTDLNSITILNENQIVISGTIGAWYSMDGGLTWTYKIILNTWGEQINKTVFLTDSTGLAFTSGGTVLKTTDAGHTWVVKVSVNYIPADYHTACFVNENLGFASAGHDDLFRTTDGGETWSLVTESLESIYSFSFIDEMKGYACGEMGAVYKTIDGGLTWTNVFFQNGYYYNTDMYAMDFTDENTGYVAGARGMILKTENAGANWAANSPTYNDIKDLVFTSNNTALALVGNAFFKTVDNGNTWVNIGPPQEDANTINFTFVSPQVGFAVGGGESGTSADNKTVYKTTDGGMTWSILPALSPSFHDSLYCLDFIDASVGVVSGGFNQPSTWRTTNGGMTWTQVNTFRFVKIKFVSQTTGYARTTNSTDRIYKTTDAGLTWTEAFSTDENMLDFDFSDENHGFFAGGQGAMFKTADGGQTWETVDIGYGNYEAVKVINENLIYVGDVYNGSLKKSEDGGATWQSILFMYGIRSINHHQYDLFASGANGVIYRSGTDVLATDSEQFQNDGFLFYPNPAVTHIVLKSTDGSMPSVALFDMSGRLILNGNPVSSEGIIDISALSSGQYILKAQNRSGQTFSRLLQVK